ncbi:MAG TPA: response regulator transcription factor [Dehalococcoidia bacterium]
MVRLVRSVLQPHNFDVATTGSSHELLSLLHRLNPELVFLDSSVGEANGLDLLREIRAWSHVPVVIFVPAGEDEHVVRALCEGADHCLHKPLNPNELLATAWALLRRVEWERFGDSRWQTIQSDGVYIDFESMRALVDGQEVHLTRTEWNLLKVLVGKAGRVVSHQELLTRVWGSEYRDDIQYLREWMSRLRRKLRRSGDPGLIRTIHGMGYIIDKAAAELEAVPSMAT